MGRGAQGDRREPVYYSMLNKSITVPSCHREGVRNKRPKTIIGSAGEPRSLRGLWDECRGITDGRSPPTILRWRRDVCADGLHWSLPFGSRLTYFISVPE